MADKKKKSDGIVFRLGSLDVKAHVETRDDGGEFSTLRIVWRDKVLTSIDSYEALRLKTRIEEWINGNIPPAGA